MVCGVRSLIHCNRYLCRLSAQRFPTRITPSTRIHCHQHSQSQRRTANLCLANKLRRNSSRTANRQFDLYLSSKKARGSETRRFDPTATVRPDYIGLRFVEAVHNSMNSVETETEVVNTLHEIFSICRMPVSHHFLLGCYDNAESHVLHDRPESLSALLRVSAQEVMPIRYGRIFDHSHNINFRSTPAINVGNVALGYCSVHYLDGDGRRHLQMRYARDDRNGKFLALTASTLGIVEVELVTLCSARRRTRVNARFQASAFRQTCETMDLSSAVKALQVMSTNRQWRQCPVCGLGGVVNLDDGSGDCACVLPMVVATEAFDFRRDRANMACQAGRFYGDCVMQVFEEGKLTIDARLATEMLTTSTTDITQLMGARLMGSGSDMMLASPGQWTAPAWASTAWASPAWATGMVEQGMETMMRAGSQAESHSQSAMKSQGPRVTQEAIIGEGEGVIDERARKIEMRKERNRLAAARSNAKRKERTDQLRDALREVVEREQMLREREKELRRENVKLRQLVGQSHSEAEVAARLAHVVGRKHQIE